MRKLRSRIWTRQFPWHLNQVFNLRYYLKRLYFYEISWWDLMVVHYRGLPPTALYLASACLTRPVTKGCVNASCFACQCIWFHSQHACQCISRSKFTHPLLHGFQWWRLLIVTLKWNWFSNITEPYPQNSFNKQWPQNRDKCSLHRYDRSLWRMHWHLSMHLRFTPVMERFLSPSVRMLSYCSLPQ